MLKKYMYMLTVATLFFFGITVQQGNAATLKFGDVDVSLTGSLRYAVGYEISDLGSTPTTPAGQADSITDLFLTNQQDSRAQLKVSYDKLSAFVDMGLKGDNKSNTISTRQLFAKYDDGTNYVLVGQAYSILSIGAPSQRLNGDKILRGYGNLDHCRTVQIQLGHVAGPMEYQFALEDTRTAITATTLPGSHKEEGIIPALLATAIYSNNGIMVSPSAYFQTYKLKANDATSDDVTVTSWALALNGSFKTSVATFSYEGWCGSNLSTLGGSLGNNDFRPSKKTSTMGVPVVTADGDIDDVRSMGGWVQLSIPIKPVVVNIGAGYQKENVENADTASVLYESDIATKAAFINFKYVILKGLYVQPEVVLYDHGDDAQKTLTGSGVTYADGDNDLGSDIYAGVHFQYDF